MAAWAPTPVVPLTQGAAVLLPGPRSLRCDCPSDLAKRTVRSTDPRPLPGNVSPQDIYVVHVSLGIDRGDAASCRIRHQPA